MADDGPLLPEGSGDYADTKNATDAALAQVGGLTTVLVRPTGGAGGWGHVGLEHAATAGDARR